MHRLVDDTLPAVVGRPIPAPTRVSVSRSIVPPAGAGRGNFWPLLWLAVVTGVGTAFRFYHLSFPALWNDETLVFWRVCGTYGQMLVPLQTDGFPPLHYSLYWLMGHYVPVDGYVTQRVLGLGVAGVATAALLYVAGRVGVRLLGASRPRRPAVWGSVAVVCLVAAAVVLLTLISAGPAHLFPARWSPGEKTLKLTPWVMRSVPAVSGSLTIPAVYFLARQMLCRWTSLVAAVFTACSAFMLFYSRDAKMYPDVWLLVTLNVGCLLWWCRTGSVTAWLCWIGAGCGMMGLHASAFAVPAVSVLFFLTQRNLSLARGGCFLAGLALIVCGAVGYATKFNHWTERVEEIGWSSSGLGWVNGFFNGNRTGPDHALYATSAFLTGYEWPRDDYVDGNPWQLDETGPIEPALLELPELAFEVVFWVIVAGAFPWPMAWRPRRDLDPPREPLWRTSLWLGSWVLLCGYGLYCYSVRGFVSPRLWVETVKDALDVTGVALLGAAVIVFVIATLSVRRYLPALGRLIQIVGVSVALYVGLILVNGALLTMALKAADEYQPLQSIWLPRYLGFMWPAVGLMAAALLMRLPTRPVRIAAVGFVLVVNLFMAYLRVTLCTEPPIDVLAHDVWLSNQPGTTVRTYDMIEHGDLAVAGSALVSQGMSAPDTPVASGRYYMQMESNHRPMSPDLFRQSYTWYRLHDNRDYTGFQRELAASPRLKKIVLWSWQRTAEQVAYDPYFRLMPGRFRFVDEKVYPVRVGWDYRQRWTWIRREYAAP